MYLAGRGSTPEQIRATMPVMALGLWPGNRWHAKISRAQAVRAIGAVLTLSGGSLLLRAL